MSAASGEFPIQIVINSTSGIGRRTNLEWQYKLSGPDVWAKLEVINCFIEEMEANWPNLVYSDQVRAVVHNVVREICKLK